MAQQLINLGTAPNDGTGDTLKTSFAKSNDNFTELYRRFTSSSTAPSSPNPGDMWYDLETGALSVYVYDGTSSQWVQISAGTGAFTLNINSGKLEYISGTQLRFAPVNGDRIKINGEIFAIPTVGITGLGSTSGTGCRIDGVAGNLAASTTYYVYCYNDAGTLRGDFSLTGHARSATTGNVGTEIKTGDDSRSLIGMARTWSSSQFLDQADARFVRSWFNRTSQGAIGAASGSTVSTSYVQATGVAYVLSWLGETVTFGFSGSVSSSGITTIQNAMGLGAATYNCANYLPAASSAGASLSAVVMPAEGLQTVTNYLASGSGSITATINANSYVWITVG
jgi:hypothetical protein